MWVLFIVLPASVLTMLLFYQQLVPLSVLFLGIIFDGVVTGLAGSAIVWCLLNLKIDRQRKITA